MITLYHQPYVESEDRFVLKAENIAKGENVFYKGSTTLKSMEEVQAITYTSNHVWRRRYGVLSAQN